MLKRTTIEINGSLFDVIESKNITPTIAIEKKYREVN
jgi:hypothetical protein